MKTSAKILSILLTVLLLLSGGTLLVMNNRLAALRTDYQAVDSRIAAARSTPAAEEAALDTDQWYEFISREKPKFHAGSVDREIYLLGQDLSADIRRHSLRIDFYNIYEKENRKYFNYTLSGSPRNCFRLIRTLSEGEKYFLIDTVSMEKNGDDCTMVILFTPAVLPELQELEENLNGITLPDLKRHAGAPYGAAPSFIASRLFYTPPAPLPEEPVEEPAQEAPQPEPIRNAPHWLSYIGHSVEGGAHQYYFLDTRTNKTIEIAPEGQDNAFEITAYLEDGFHINLSGEEYYVSKY